MTQRFRLESILAEPLTVPLREPFVVATGRLDATPSVLVSAELFDLQTGRRVTGLGESATFPGITRESRNDVLVSLAIAGARMRGALFDDAGFGALTGILDAQLGNAPVARAGLETAVLDAMSRHLAIPLHRLLAGDSGPVATEIVTDMTIPMGESDHMGELAAEWWAKGFRCFKVKVGGDVAEDLQALEAIVRRTPDAAIRLDANAGYSAAEALALIRGAEEMGARVECFEQPCGRLALEAMAEVTAGIAAPVVADESVSSLADLDRVIHARAARGVNLKLVKSGGPLRAFELGRAARAAGFSLMVGAMVETRLGIAAAANVAAALGGVDFPDLDTAHLLREDPFVGGYVSDGPRLTLSSAAGLGVDRC